MRFAILSATCLFAAAASAKIIEIQAGNPAGATQPEKLTFTPDVVEANPEDTIRFIFNGNHTVTQQDDFNKCAAGAPAGATGFDSGPKAKGETFDIPATAMVPGATINYYCKINEGAHCREPNLMQGAIVVTAGAGAAAGAGEPAAAAAAEPAAAAAAEPAAAAAPAADPATLVPAAPAAEPAAAGTPAAGSTPAAAANPAAGATPAAAASPAAGATQTAGAAANSTTINVVVGKDGANQFSPSTIEASAGDTIMFMWTGGQKKHNIVPADQPMTCVRSTKADSDPILKALASGQPQTSGQHEFKIPANVKVGDMMNFFCSVGTHCSADKMYGMIKIVAPGTSTTGTGAAAAGATAAPGAGATAAAATDANDAPPGTVKSAAARSGAASVAIVAAAAGAALFLA